MNFLCGRKTVVFALVLILGTLPFLGAQPNPSFPKIPESLGFHLPESSASKATVGTLSGDIDAFMSTVNWSSIKNFNKTFFLGGVDEWGIALGFAKKFGNVYLGASYSGDLIDEVYRRIANKNVEPFWKVDKKTDASAAFETYLENENGRNPPGLTVSNNDVNFIIGAGPFGLRLGFAERIESVQNSSKTPYWAFTDSLESSLRPNLELGFNVSAGKVTVKPALRAAIDIRQSKSKTGYLDYNFTSNPSQPAIYWVIQEDQINFLEPAVGLTLGLEFPLSETISMEVALEGDGYFRLYRAADDPDPVSTRVTYGDASVGYPALPLFPSNGSYLLTNGNPYPPGSITVLSPLGTISIPTDFWGSGAPSFTFTGELVEQRVSLGLKIAIDGALGLRTTETDTGIGVISSTALTLVMAPDIAFGASFHLIPEHFSLHAGIGVGLFSYEQTVLSGEGLAGNAIPKTTTSKFGLPSARFGGGLTINLTQAVAMDAMVLSSGLDLDSARFNLFLTVKK
jgi:hypothetical protein